jgi:ATP-dependent Clp protease adaptor protein ClpS
MFMRKVHEKGKGIAGVYSKEVAETKSIKANNLAKSSGFPLLTTIEPE